MFHITIIMAGQPNIELDYDGPFHEAADYAEQLWVRNFNALYWEVHQNESNFYIRNKIRQNIL